MLGLSALFHRPEEESRIELPNAVLVFNHTTRTVFMCVDIPEVEDDGAYNDLQAHFKKRGYFLQVLALPLEQISAATSIPPSPKKS